MVQKDQRDPLYRSLMRELKQWIEQQPDGDTQQLPTEVVLCEQYGVSRITVRRALTELANQGLIYRVHGKGTFISSRQENVVPVETIYRQFASIHGRHEFITCAIVQAPPVVAGLLGATEDEQVVYVARRKITDGIPSIYERAYARVAKLPAGWRRSDFERDELFLETFTRYGLRPKTSRLHLNAALADSNERTSLEIEDGSPVLRIRRVALDADRGPLWVVVNTMRADRGAYEMEVNVPEIADTR